MVFLKRVIKITGIYLSPKTAPVLILACILVLAGCFAYRSRTAEPVDAGSRTESFILIDPGHGGADGGAVAADGTTEKDLNLKIASSLADMLKVCGYSVQMTRDADISVHSPEVGSLREQKISDMKNRLKLYEQSRLAVSIHQNKFTQSQYSGTQVFYSGNHPASQTLAEAIRASVVETLQPENTRELKKATKDIYLLNKTTVPAVIVECGFISNTNELNQLKTEEYQKQMACAIACGVLAA